MAMAARFAAALTCCCLAAGCASSKFHPGEVGPEPRPVAPPAPQAVRAAIDRGAAFLARNQNSNGSWGTARYKAFNVFMPVPGGHQSMRAAVTALSVSALIEAQSADPAVAQALRRGEEWLIENEPRIRRSAARVMYNNWAHAYVLQALTLVFEREPPRSLRRTKIRRLIEGQIDRLVRHQYLDGGWGYYSFGSGTMRSAANSNSFMTATVLVALHDARRAGFAIPERVVRQAMRSIRLQRRPDFAYAYKGSASPYPTAGLHQPPGSLARSQACNAAMRLWGDKKTTPAVIRTWLNRLAARNDWLGLARKQRFPHQSYYAVAAYFYHYGHYYAGICLDLAPAEDRPRLAAHLAHLLLPRQEKDGSWWDFPLYNYHQQYGTAFAVMSLKRCLAHLPPGAASR